LINRDLVADGKFQLVCGLRLVAVLDLTAAADAREWLEGGSCTAGKGGREGSHKTVLPLQVGQRPRASVGKRVGEGGVESLREEDEKNGLPPLSLSLSVSLSLILGQNVRLGDDFNPLSFVSE
jgi:hypothetical protein